MVTRRRVNLSFSERDFERLAAAASREGKTPSTLAADIVRSALPGRAFLPPKAFVAARSAVSRGGRPAEAPKAPVAHSEPSGLTRQQRRALERAKAKGGR